jgi:hypothetical protein
MAYEMRKRGPIADSPEAHAGKLRALKSQFFTPANREARASRSRTALDTSSRLRLSREQWKSAAENPELEEEF